MQRIKPLRGPRNVLCVVVVTKSATGNRTVVNPGSDQSGVVGHVDHQQRPDFPSNLGKLVVRNLARIGAGTGDDQLRLVLACERGDLVEVEPMVLRIDAVGVKVVELTADIQSHAVGQVPALGEIQPEHRVARLEAAQVDGRVGLRPAVRLDVGGFGPEQLLGALDRQILDHIDVLAAPIVAASRIALGVLVGQARCRRPA